jgi:PAS domain S-box-containing protein
MAMRGIAGLILTVIVGLSYYQWGKYHSANAEAARSRQVGAACDRVLSSLSDAETGQRGFLLTGEDRYLEPYNQAVRSLPDELATLKRLLAEHPNQSSDIVQLDTRVNEKLAELRQLLELRRMQGTAPVIGIVLRYQSQRTTDAIRALCAQIERNENATQDQSSVEGEAAAQIMLLATVTGSLALLLLFAVGLEPFVIGDPRSKERTWILRYGAAVLSVVVAILLRKALTPLIGPSEVPFAAFYPVVVFAAWFGGLRAGALSIVLSAISADYFFSEPIGSLLIYRRTDQISLLFFIVIGLGAALLSNSQRRAVARATLAENAERDERQRLKGIIDSAMDAIITVDGSQRILVFNRSAEQVFRCSASDVLSQSLDTLLPERFRKAHRGYIAQFGGAGITTRSMSRPDTLWGLRSDGEEFPIEASISQIEKDGEKLFTVILRDITERKRAEEELRRERNRLGLALSAGKMGVFEMDLIDNLMWWSPESYSLFGVEPDNFTLNRESLASLVLPGDRDLLEHHFQESVALHAPINHEFRILQPDGRTRWINCQGQTEYEDGRRAVRCFGIYVDITARRQSEQMLRKWEKLSAAARLSAAMAHEINNPLGAVVNLIFLAKGTSGVPASVEELLVLAEQELDRVAQATRQALGFYRESAATERIDIPTLLDSVLKLLSHRIDSKRIRVERGLVKCDAILGVRGEIRQVISNLISNAIDAVTVEGNVIVGVHPVAMGRDSGVEIIIADDGSGIAAEHVDQIFEPFFTTKHGTGTGLGLWVAKEIVERHGGSIEVGPRNNGGETCGATFTIKLPLGSERRAGKPPAAFTKLAQDGEQHLARLESKGKSA